MSKLDPKVHWRLNDLLRAGKKAKEFAAVSWSDPAEQLNEQFVPWHPEDSTHSVSIRKLPLVMELDLFGETSTKTKLFYFPIVSTKKGLRLSIDHVFLDRLGQA